MAAPLSGDRVVIVGSRTSSAPRIAAALRARSHAVLGPYDESHLDEVMQHAAECAVVDLSGDDGPVHEKLAEVCHAVAVDVLVITELGDVGSRLRALRLGASDHCVAPFEMQEVVARVEVLLARRRRLRRDRLVVGDVTVWMNDRRLVRNGHEVRLTKREFDVFVALMMAENKAVSKDQLLAQIWGNGSHNGDLVEAHVSTLRRKVEATGPPMIRTVHGQGYVMYPTKTPPPTSREALLEERARLLRERDEAVLRRDELVSKLREQMGR